MTSATLKAPGGNPGAGPDPRFRGSGSRPADPGFRRDGDAVWLRVLTNRRPRYGAPFPVAWLLSIILMVLATSFAHAVRPDEMLRDPALESRARDISRELRCLVCRNQSIDDSDADLAHDLRVLVRERLEAGDSDSEVVAYVRARYGDYVLLRPPLTVATVLLWGGPVLILLLGGLGAARFYQTRGRGGSPTVPLTADERRRLDALLGDET